MQLMADDAQLRADWNDEYGDRMQKLVFIGQHLDKPAIKAALDKCLQ
jgi:G3E family GTPase